MQQRLSFPKEIIFDQYRAGIVDNSNKAAVQEIEMALRLEGISPHSAKAAHLKQALLDSLDQSKVFVLTPEALEVVIATTERLRQKAQGLVLDLPALPMWVEFEGKTLQEWERSIVALWFVPVTMPGHRARDGSFLVIRIGNRQTAPSEDVFEYHAASQSWQMYLSPGCRHATSCPLASQMRQHQRLVLSERADAFAALSAGCLCYEDGQHWAQFLWVLTQMLRAEGAKHTVIDRRFQLRSRKTHTTTHEKEEARAKAGWNATHPVYIRISLEHRFHVRRAHHASGVALVYEEGDQHLTQVVGHWRLLVPAPDKPWRGEQPRIIWVRSHARWVHGKRKVRYYVTP